MTRADRPAEAIRAQQTARAPEDRAADERFMTLALDEARAAEAGGDVPIGCVIVAGDGRVIGRGRNRREADCDPTAHAEIMALREAAKAAGKWRLEECTVYVTLEPCPMCAGAMVNARIRRVVYGCADPKAGAVRTLYSICEDARLNHRTAVTAGVLEAECAGLLRAFFEKRREMGKK
jgi:tRNA(adenine34) deaminase